MAYRGARGEGRAARERKFDYAAKFVASLAYLMLKQTESVGLATFGARLETWLPPHAGSPQLARVIDALERTSPAGASDVPAAIAEVAERLGRRSLVIVVSDFFADAAKFRAALARLRHGRHETIALRVLDVDEVEFPFRQWLRLRGLEGEGARLCEPALMRQRYLAAFGAHAQALHDTCRGAGVEFHTLSTGRPLADSLVAFLRHRAGAVPANF
jgi:uncharacterized protein (DUF58 family)